MSQAPSPSAPESQLRNIGIVAHINAGKTTLSERILFTTGRQRYLGEVDQGTATMDWMPEEQQRGISITSAVTTVQWKGYRIQLIDTPGHVDFTAEVHRALRVLDGVIVVVDGVRGVESQTEIVWRRAAERGVPCLVFVNKLDRPSADFAGALASLRARLRATFLPLVVPERVGEHLVALHDVVRGSTDRLDPAEHGPFAAEPWRLQVIESLADSDETVLAEYVAGRPISARHLDQAIRDACRQRRAVPVLCGSALRNQGVAWLLDAVCRYLPSPVDIGPVPACDDPATIRQPARNEPLCGLCFKLQEDELGLASLIRLYSGQLAPGDLIGVAGRAEAARVLGLWRVHAGEREPLDSAGSGDVVAVAVDGGLTTGDTIHALGHPIRLEAMRFPEPVLVASLEPESGAAFPELQRAAAKLVREDPTLALHFDPSLLTLTVSGMGELHLEVFCERLEKALRQRVRLGTPQVAVWEAIAGSAGAAAECRRDAGTPQEATAEVEVLLEPRPGLGPAVVADLCATPVGESGRSDRLAVLEELAGMLRTGLRHAAPARDLALSLIRTRASGPADRALLVTLEASRVAVRKAAEAARTRLLEPYCEFEVECPVAHLSGVLGDLGSRGADLGLVNAAGDQATVTGKVRLAAMLGYATRLRSLTRGLGEVQLATVGLVPRAPEQGSEAEKALRSLDRS